MSAVIERRNTLVAGHLVGTGNGQVAGQIGKLRRVQIVDQHGLGMHSRIARAVDGRPDVGDLPSAFANLGQADLFEENLDRFATIIGRRNAGIARNFRGAIDRQIRGRFGKERGRDIFH